MSIDWDGWRASYDTMSHADQQAFYDKVTPLVDRQASYDLDAVLAFVTPDVRFVVEYGGYDGGLAADVLPHRPNVKSWRNYEISRVAAIDRNVCHDPRYLATIPVLPLWEFERGTPDVAISCHMIEHITAPEVEQLLSRERAQRVLFNAPLSEDGQVWDGYDGSHILTWGWRQVDEAMRWYGYEPASANGETRTWSR